MRFWDWLCHPSPLPLSSSPLIRPGREGSILAALVAGQQVHRMLPQFDHEGERIRGILAVEIRGSAVQVFEAERVVDDFLDDDAWYAVVIARRQQGFHDHI